MADIKIENIDLSGFDLFTDPEGFLTDLNDSDGSSIIGGILQDDIYTNAGSCCCAGSCTCPAT